uniref:Uncharacterized protein n=1 Tax=Solanum tuberosum TaxID=4113 RepID=M1DHC1_SOLTU
MDIWLKLVQTHQAQTPTSRVLLIIPSRDVQRLKVAREWIILEKTRLSSNGVISKDPPIRETIKFHRFKEFTKPQLLYVPAVVREFYMAYALTLPKKINGTILKPLEEVEVCGNMSDMPKLIRRVIEAAFVPLRDRHLYAIVEVPLPDAPESMPISVSSVAISLAAAEQSSEVETTFGAIINYEKIERVEDVDYEKTDEEEIQSEDEEQQAAMNLTELRGFG